MSSCIYESSITAAEMPPTMAGPPGSVPVSTPIPVPVSRDPPPPVSDVLPQQPPGAKQKTAELHLEPFNPVTKQEGEMVFYVRERHIYLTVIVILFLVIVFLWRRTQK